MLALAQEETSIDLFTLREEIRRRNKEEAAGGPAYLAGLTDGLPRGVNVGHYARTVGEKATSRQLIRLGSELKSRCYADDERLAEILERMESQMFRIASREIRGGLQPTRELAPEAFKEIEETSRNRGPVSGIDTGFIDLNRMTGAWRKNNGQFIPHPSTRLNNRQWEDSIAADLAEGSVWDEFIEPDKEES